MKRMWVSVQFKIQWKLKSTYKNHVTNLREKYQKKRIKYKW